jgi:hypothetical protein
MEWRNTSLAFPSASSWSEHSVGGGMEGTSPGGAVRHGRCESYCGEVASLRKEFLSLAARTENSLTFFKKKERKKIVSRGVAGGRGGRVGATTR